MASAGVQTFEFVIPEFTRALTQMQGMTGALLGFSQAQARLGSSVSTTAALVGPGRAFGLDMVAMARQLQAFGQTGLGAGLLGGFGIAPQFNFGQMVDRGEMMRKFVDGLVRMLREGQRDRVIGTLQAAGMEDLIVMLEALADPATEQSARELQKMLERLASPEGQRQSRAYMIEVEKLNQAWARAKETIGMRVLPIITGLIQGFTDLLSLDFSRLFDFSSWGDLFEKMFGKGKGSTGSTPQLRAMDAQTQATIDNTNELRLSRIGIHGGGRRARTAIPAAFGPGMGHALSANLTALTVKLGAQAVAL